MDPAGICPCDKVVTTWNIPKSGKSVDFSKLQKVLGAGKYDWFDSLSAQAADRGREVNTSLPHSTSIYSPATPGFKQQPPNATTPGLVGSLTPLSAWALLSSQDTSTPTVDRSITSCGSVYVSHAPVDSCLKTCKGISERLGLPIDDTSMFWTNSMATPCLGGEPQQDQESQEPSTPAIKSKGFPRALFTPDQGQGDSEELVKELNMTQEEDVSQSATKDWTCHSRFSNMDLRKNMLLKSTGLSNEQGVTAGSPDRFGSDSGSCLITSSLGLGAGDGQIAGSVWKGKESNMIYPLEESLVFAGMEGGDGQLAASGQKDRVSKILSPCEGSLGNVGLEAGNEAPKLDNNPKGSAEGSPVTPLLKSRRKMRRRSRGTAAARSPLVCDVKGLSDIQKKNLGEIDLTNEDVKFKLDILRVAAGFEGDVSTLLEKSRDIEDKEKDNFISAESKTEGSKDYSYQKNHGNDHQNNEGGSISVMSEPERSTSPILNRKIRKGDSHKHVKKRHSICTDRVEDDTRSIVSQVLSDFMDSPSVTARRSCPPSKSRKRKSFEDQPHSGSSEAVFSTPSPLDSQTSSLQSILSSSKKRKFGSSRKRVRFAEKLCDREGETPTVAKKLDYVKIVDSEVRPCSEKGESQAENGANSSSAEGSTTLCSSTKVSTTDFSSSSLTTTLCSQSGSDKHSEKQNENVPDICGQPPEKTLSDGLIPDGEQILFESDVKEDVDIKFIAEGNQTSEKLSRMKEIAQNNQGSTARPSESDRCEEKEGSHSVGDNASDLCLKESPIASTIVSGTYRAKTQQLETCETAGSSLCPEWDAVSASIHQHNTTDMTCQGKGDNFSCHSSKELDSESTTLEVHTACSEGESSTISVIPKPCEVKSGQALISNVAEAKIDKELFEAEESFLQKKDVTSSLGHLQTSVEEEDKYSTNVANFDSDVPETAMSKPLKKVTSAANHHQTCVEENLQASCLVNITKDDCNELSETAVSKSLNYKNSTSSHLPTSGEDNFKTLDLTSSKEQDSDMLCKEVMPAVTSPVRQTDDLFSQVSPSSLSEMCLVATSDVQRSTVDSISMGISENSQFRSKGSTGSVSKECGKELFKVKTQELSAQNYSCKNADRNKSGDGSNHSNLTKDFSALLPKNVNIKLSESPSQFDAKINPEEQEPNLASGSVKDNQKPSLKNALSKRPKKKFFYPTSSQIKAVSPKTIFNFQGTEPKKLDSIIPESEDSNADNRDTDLPNERRNKDISSGVTELKQDKEPPNTCLDFIQFEDAEVEREEGNAQKPLQVGGDQVPSAAKNKLKQSVPSAFNMDFVKFSEIFDENMEEEEAEKASDKTECRKSLDNLPLIVINTNVEHQLKSSVRDDEIENSYLKASPQSGSRGQATESQEAQETKLENARDISIPSSVITEKEKSSQEKTTVEFQNVSQNRDTIDKDPAEIKGAVKNDMKSRLGEASNWILNTQDVHYMVEDVQEELFSDIEFSQTSDKPDKPIKPNHCQEMDNNSDFKNEQVVVSDGRKEDRSLSSDEIIGSHSVCEDIHIFKKPEIPEKKTAKDSGLSDSDTDALLSDMDMSGDGEMDSKSKPTTCSDQSSEFETCVSELESSIQAKGGHFKKVPASSSVSETDTDEYITSTEEVKELSPEPKQLNPRHKISKSRSLRKQSVLLSKSQLASDSDSDFSPAGTKPARRGYSNIQAQESAGPKLDPILVSESNSLLEWTDLDSKKSEVERKKDTSHELSKMAEDQSNHLECDQKRDQNTSNHQEPCSLVANDVETKPISSGRVSDSVWSDLEQGEADEVDEEVFFKVSHEQTVRKNNMQGKNTATLMCDSNVPMEQETIDVFSEKDLDESHPTSPRSVSLIKCKTVTISDPNADREADKLGEKRADIGMKESISCPSNTDTDICVGFSTAGGRKFNLDMESLHKASSLFDDVDCQKLKITENIQNNLSGFAMASGKGIKMNAESLKKANSLFSVVDEINTIKVLTGSKACDDHAELKPSLRTSLFESINPNVSGFSMASGKHVNLNQAALEKATSIFESDTPIEGKNVKSKHIGSCKKKTIINMAEVKASFQTVEAGGFSTASGKNLAASDGGLERAMKMLSDDELSASNINKPITLNKPTGIAAEGDSNSLEAMLEDLLKSKKGIQQESQQRSPSSNTIFGNGNPFSVDNIEQPLNLKLLSSSSKSQSTIADGSTAGIKGFQLANNRLHKGNPMLKPKGFRPFKKPRIVPKPVENELNKDVVVKASATSQVRSETEPSTSDMNDMLLLEFSKDMIELSQNSQNFGNSVPPVIESVQRKCVEVRSTDDKDNRPMVESNGVEMSSLSDQQVNSEQGHPYVSYPTATANGSDAHLKLMDVLFDGDMSSQCVPNPERDPERLFMKSVNKNHSEKSNLKSRTMPTVAFQTASGKNVSVSETSLQFSRKLWNDSLDHESNIKTGVNTNINFDHVVPSIDESTDKTKEELIAQKKVLQGSNPSSGLFQTASGKDVSISKSSLEKAKKLWNNDPQPTNDSEDTSNNMASTESADERTFSSGNVSLIKSKMQVASSFSSSYPFKAAVGTSVSVPTEALATGSVDPPGSDLRLPSCSSVGESKASEHGKKLSSKKIMDAPSGLFHTASGIPVTVSASSVEHGKRLFEGNEEQTETSKLNTNRLTHGQKLLVDKQSVSASPLFETASACSVRDLAESLPHGHQLLSDEHNQQKKEMSLFQTASGSSVRVSAKAMAHGQKLLSDDQNTTTSSFFQTASGAPVAVSAKALAHGKTLFIDDDKTNVALAPFLTASGSSVSVSAKASAEGKKLMNEGQMDGVGLNLFQTASGSSVHISAKSLAHSKKLWNEEEKNLPGANLFQTASGSSVSVSAKSLAQGKKLWNEEEKIVPSANPFQTASGSSVNVSAKSLTQAKKLWNEEEKNLPSANLFQTASGSSVSVSVKSFAQGKKLWNEEEKNVPSANFFQTDSGASVNVSTKSLAQAKKLWNKEEKNLRSANLFQTGAAPEVSSGAVSKEIELVQGKTTSQTDQQTSGSRSDYSAQKRDHRKMSDYEEAIDSQGRVISDAGDRGNRRPLLCTPEDVTQDHVARDGRRFRPVRSTSFTPPQRNEEYTIEAVTSKVGLNAHQPVSSSFKTPYRNTPFLAPAKQSEIQSKRNSKMPVFYPKASLKIGKQEKMFSKERDVKKISVVSQEDASDFVLKDVKENLEGTEHGKTKTFGNNERTRSCLQPDNHGPKTVLIKEIVQESAQKSVIASSCHSMQDQPDSSKSQYIPQSGNLEKARQKQEEIIQAKKKQKIRPCSGRLFRDKMSGEHKLKLGDLYKERSSNEEELLTMGVRVETCDLGSSTAEEFRFPLSLHYPKLGSGVLVGDGAQLVPDNSGYAGKEEFHRAFLTMDGVDPKLTSDLWIYNHYRWIVWKLAAYEVALPSQFGGRCLTPNNVMLQLKYRYDREVDNCQRSCIKKIVERDDTAVKRMVLCVAGVVSTGQSGEASAETMLELTDGWYSIRARPDVGLCDLVGRKCIQVGDKICISGAELAGSQDACPPLEIPDSLHLKICTNSCRPAPWDSRLGYQCDPRPLCVPISSLHAEGGVAGCLDVVVTRIYPLMYMEKLAEGGSVFRTEEGEERVRREYERRKQDKMERLYTEIQSGLEVSEGKKGRRRSRKRWTQQEVENLQTGQEIYEAVEGSLAPEELHSWLSVYQRNQMEDYQRHLQEKRQQQLQDQLHRAWEEAQQGQTSRNVTPVLKIRLSGCAKKDIDAKTSTVLTVWRPSGDWLSLEEGRRYKMYTLTASPARTRLESHSVHLTASRQSRLQSLPVDENYLDLLFEPREVWLVKDLRSRSPAFKEFDFVGIVVSIQTDSQRNCDTVCVSDTEGDVLNIRFLGKTQSFGVEEQMSVGKSFVGMNLILKGVYQTVLAEACHEVSRFSASSKHAVFRKSLDRFTGMSMRERNEFLEQARSRQSLPNEEPRQNNQAITTPEKFFSDLPSECLQRLFSPMDEGQPSKGENSGTPDALVKKRRVALRERSSKLLAYGSPKPLSALNVQVSPATTRAFKSPFNPPKTLGESPR